MDLNAVVPLIAGLGALAKVIWELYFSPLARQHIPGPKRAAVSDIWSYWQLLRRRRVMTFHSLFERYGPVVRVGPNRVVFRDIDAIRTIYGTHDFRKSDWYSPFTFVGTHNMFSTDDPVYHTRSRRVITPAFRGENLRASGPALLQEMEELVDRLRRDCAGGGFVNVIHLFPQVTLDVLGLAVLGVRFNQVATGQVPDVEKQLECWFLDKLLVQPLPSIVRKLPIPRLQEIIAGDGIIAKYIEELYSQTDEKSTEAGWSMLDTYKHYRDEQTGEPLPLPQVSSELSVMFIAGTDTTAISLTYVAYYLSARKEMWEAMRAELGPVNLEAENFIEKLRGLTYLNAFIREILRVHGPGAVFHERIVPAGGAMLGGHFLPAGTRVGSQSYSSHRIEEVFPQSHVVDPLRWVRLDEATGRYVNRGDITPEMNSNYYPFGIGVRSCVGKALAELELVLVTATLVKNFRIRPHETTTPESMGSMELLTVRPRATQCRLHFEYAPIATT